LPDVTDIKTIIGDLLGYKGFTTIIKGMEDSTLAKILGYSFQAPM